MSPRFVFIFSGILCLPLIIQATPRKAAASSPPGAFLESTEYIDHEHPEIRKLVRRLTANAADDRKRAVAIHDFVRDEIRFGFSGDFYDQRASAVLAGGRRFCNTKSTLFVALLRAAGIPARQRFVDIDADILHGLVDTGGAYVDHSYAEVYLPERD